MKRLIFGLAVFFGGLVGVISLIGSCAAWNAEGEGRGYTMPFFTHITAFGFEILFCVFCAMAVIGFIVCAVDVFKK